MRRSTRLRIAGQLMIASFALSGCTPTSTTPRDESKSSTPPPSNAWTDLGRILGPTDFGQPSGSIIGDPTGVVLPDGRIRLFVFVDGKGVWRALSTDASGTAFRVEGPCTLIPHVATNTMGTPWGEPRARPSSRRDRS